MGFKIMFGAEFSRQMGDRETAFNNYCCDRAQLTQIRMIGVCREWAIDDNNIVICRSGADLVNECM